MLSKITNNLTSSRQYDIMSAMKPTKVTIYLPDELTKTVKKHVIDTGETLSAFMQAAAELKLKHDVSRDGKKKLLARKKTEELDNIIRDLEKSR